MKQRIFIALLIPPALQQIIGEWRKNHLPSVALAKEGKVRWLKGENLHITLVPPWYEENTEEIKARLKELRGAVPPFTLHFEKVTFGPDPRQPRLIWAQGKTPAELFKLKAKIEAALKKPADPRPFCLHLTLARLPRRRARFRPEDFSDFPIKKLDELVDWSAKISSFALMESRLLSAGAEYEALDEIALL